MVTPIPATSADLIRITVDGVDYVGIPRALAGPVGRCIQSALTAAAKAAGADVPRHVPLWATSLQLEIESRLAAGSDPGTSVDGAEREPRLSTHDVAKRLRIGARAVTKAASDGRLVGEQVGTVWTFRPADVDAFANRRASA